MKVIAPLAWIVSLTALIITLHILGDTFALPQFDRSAIEQWLTDTDLTIVVLSVVRVIALIASWYLVIVTVLNVLAQLSRWQPAIQAIDACSIPAVRAISIRIAGMAAAGSLAIPAMPMATAATAHAAAPATETPVLRHLARGEQLPSPPSSEEPTLVVTQAAPEPEQTPATTHVVQRGENFWTIAQTALQNAQKRTPTETEITTYWRQLVKANQTSLANPANADLLFPGQTITLPENGV